MRDAGRRDRVDAAQALADAGIDAARARREGGPRPHQRHRRHARHALPRHPRPAPPPHHGRRRRGAQRRGPARVGRAVRRGPHRHAPAPGPGGVGVEHAPDPGGLAASWRATASWTTPETPRAPASRTPTPCAARPRCTAPPATPWTTPPRSRAGSWRPRSTTRWSPPTGAWSPTATSTARPSRYVLDFLAIAAADLASMSERRTDRFLDVVALRGSARVPRARPRRRLRPHDRPVHGRRDRLGDEAPGRAGERGLDPELRHAGGPRVHGLVRARASSAAPWTGSPACSRSRCSRRRAPSTCARRPPRRVRARCTTPSAPSCPAPDRTATSPRRSSTWCGSSATGRIAAAAAAAVGHLD